MRCIKSFLYFIFICFLSLAAQAQTPEVGIIAGGAGYMGDLNQDNPVKINDFSGGVFVRLNLDAYFTLGAYYNYGRIRGADATSKNADFKQRDLNFLTPIHEISLQSEFNFFDYFSGGGRSNFTPYIFTGVGGYFFNPKVKLPDGRTIDVSNRKTEGQTSNYRTYGISIPYGVGAKFRIGEAWTLFGQVGYRHTFTDYLDDVSGTYPELSAFDDSQTYNLSDPSGNRPKHSQRGDLRKRDTYMFAGIGISFTFVSQKCYTF